MTSTAIDPVEAYHFACPHCQTVLVVPYAALGQSGPCPCCGAGIMAPPPSEYGTPVLPTIQVAPISQPTAQPAKPAPFVAKRAVKPGSIELTANPARRAEARRMRRQKAMNRACSNFLDSTLFRWVRRLLIITLLGFLAFTIIYMKKHKWRPWWVPQDPRELELLKLRDPANGPLLPKNAAYTDGLDEVPLPSPRLPNQPKLDDLSLKVAPATHDPLDQAATLTPSTQQ